MRRCFEQGKGRNHTPLSEPHLSTRPPRPCTRARLAALFRPHPGRQAGWRHSSGTRWVPDWHHSSGRAPGAKLTLLFRPRTGRQAAVARPPRTRHRPDITLSAAHPTPAWRCCQPGVCSRLLCSLGGPLPHGLFIAALRPSWMRIVQGSGLGISSCLGMSYCPRWLQAPEQAQGTSPARHKNECWQYQAAGAHPSGRRVPPPLVMEAGTVHEDQRYQLAGERPHEAQG
mmetsp:Transcript_19503/g.57810  ORF Transcript_19503/g.57810 Transcript_19503/m.57810 type:complete len:228 (-) Transcript_19503:1982-2665(-)